MKSRYLALLLLANCLPATIVDRLAVAVGQTVITELQIDEDLRVAALLSDQPINRDLESRRVAADRLIEQMLVRHEIEIGAYPMPAQQEVDTLFEKIGENLGGPDHLKQLLLQYRISEDTLRAHLAAQLVTLRFIEFRFRPDVNLSDSEVEAEYRHRSGPAAAPMSAAGRAQLAQAMTEERTDAALETWLAEARKQINIVYLDTSLQ